MVGVGIGEIHGWVDERTDDRLVSRLVGWLVGRSVGGVNERIDE